MTVRVLLFAAARELFGAGEVEMHLPTDARYFDLRTALMTNCPQMAAVVARAHFAADERYVNDGEMVSHTSEIALIPPG